MTKRVAVVTGATGGFGQEFVKIFLKKETVDEVWTIARDKERLAAQEGEAEGKIRAFSVDVSNLCEIEAFGKTLESESPDIRYLVNAAGFAKFCAYSDISAEVSLNLIAVNCGGAVGVGLACLPYMTRGARIINISSASSFQPLPYLNLYAASKVFLKNYTRALNVELKPRGITATAVCPGWMPTGLYRRARTGAEREISVFPMQNPPRAVAERAVRDAEDGRDMSVFGNYAKLQRLLAKILPERVMMRLFLMQQGF